MIGFKHGELTVIEQDEEKTKQKSKAHWFCKCSCGNIVSKEGRALRDGKTRINCGCAPAAPKKMKPKKEKTQEEKQLKRCKTLHASMVSRCYNPTDTNYQRYGAKEIHVAEAWHDKEQFIIDMFPSFLEFEAEHGVGTASIDRIDNSLGYCPSNCRWLTLNQQAHNRTTNINITIHGKHYATVPKILEDYPYLTEDAIRARRKRGWDNNEIVDVPVGMTRKQYRASKQQERWISVLVVFSPTLFTLTSIFYTQKNFHFPVDVF